MNKILTTLTTLSAALMLTAAVSARAAGPGAPDVNQIMAKNKEATKVKDVTSNATLKTGDKVKEFHWWRKLSPDAQRFNTLIRFDSPVEVRNEGVLFLEYDNDENDVLIYLPAFKKVRRVENQQQSTSFMASEMSYSDISNPKISDWKYKLVKTVSCEGKQCFEIDASPANDKVKERTGYGRKVLWVRTDNFVQVRADFYGVGGELIKKMIASKFQNLAGGKWMATEITFTNAKTNKASTIAFNTIKVNTNLDDSLFTEQNLSHIK